ncbi:hypothetical protein [Desulfobulbus propionicus]|uniref:hypothetical protein n=1 Tax=Desulfobulbus propionicus TaxID=894 RepID=UPI00030F5209|nr:hypothetical protein [Desulfobulbus propionicus]
MAVDHHSRGGENAQSDKFLKVLHLGHRNVNAHGGQSRLDDPHGLVAGGTSRPADFDLLGVIKATVQKQVDMLG